MLVMSCTLFSSFIFIASCVGPDQMVPLSGPLSVLLTAAATLSSIDAFFGGAPSYNPLEAYQGERDPLTKALVQSMRLDTYSDAGYILTCKHD